jgi:hypothetical protein
MAVRACVCAPLVHFLQTGSRTVCAPTTAPDCSQDGVERQAKRQGLRGESLTRSLATVPLHSGRRSIPTRTVYFRSTSLPHPRTHPSHHHLWTISPVRNVAQHTYTVYFRSTSLPYPPVNHHMRDNLLNLTLAQLSSLSLQGMHLLVLHTCGTILPRHAHTHCIIQPKHALFTRNACDAVSPKPTHIPRMYLHTELGSVRDRLTLTHTHCNAQHAQVLHREVRRRLGTCDSSLLLPHWCVPEQECVPAPRKPDHIRRSHRHA